MMNDRPDKYAGMTDREAFVEIQIDLQEAVRLIINPNEGIIVNLKDA